ncbi:MAG: ATP-binding protein [Blastocatellia bacterium]
MQRQSDPEITTPSAEPSAGDAQGESLLAQAKEKGEDGNLFQLMVQSVKDYAIFMLDTTGHIISWNAGAQRLKGYQADEIIGKHFSIFYTEEAKAIKYPQYELKEAVAQGRYEDVGWRVRKDGTTFWADVIITAVFDAQGVHRGFAKVTRDMTERRIWEEQIRQLNEELQQRVNDLARSNIQLAQKSEENEMFVYSVSHDMRTPLVNLQGFSQELGMVSEDLKALLNGESVPPELRARGVTIIEGEMAESVQFIQTAVSHLSKIIDALLRLSRAGRIIYQVRKVNLKEMVERINDALNATIKGRGAKIIIHDLPPTWGDPAALEQLFSNLISNALNYLDPKRAGVIEIGCVDTVFANEDEVEQPVRAYYVRDNGLGLSDIERGKLFRAFQRFHPEAARGEGMGLAIVRRIIERHNGRVWVESKAGEGTTFFVTLAADQSLAEAGEESEG